MKIGITVLGSGSKGNCTVIHCGNDAIMVDAGFSGRETKKRMVQAGLENVRIHGILVTHEHEDHIRGLRICSQQYDAPIFATMKCAQALRYKDENITQMATFAPGGAFALCNFTVCPFSIPHDAADPVGFTFICNSAKLAVATDMGYVSSTVQYQLRDCDAMMLESNHDLNMLAASDRPWNLKQRIMGRQGHLSNDAFCELLASTISQRTKNIILAHLSGECNKVELAKYNAEQCLAYLHRQDVSLDIACQDAPLHTVWIESN